jgi:hypothetical protein
MKIYIEDALQEEVSEEILTFFQKSLYIKTLNQISDGDIEIHLRSQHEFEALNHLILWNDPFKKDLNHISLDEIVEYREDILYLLEFYMIQSYRYEYQHTCEYIHMYENFDFHEMIESEDLQEYFFQRALYLPHRKQVSFFPFLNSFLLHKEIYGREDFYRFLRVFNEYSKRMKWLGKKIHHTFDSFCPFSMKKNYSEEDFAWIESMLFPKEIFQIMDDGYDSHQKICEFMELTEETTPMMKDLLTCNPIIMAGSSMMYLTIRDYPRDQINDMDIWVLEKGKKRSEHQIHHGVSFTSQFQHLFDTPMEYTMKKGIIDLHFPEKNLKFQILNVRMRDGYSIIDYFDFSCVRAFLRNEVNSFIFTTDFCESIIHRKLYDVYDIHNMVRQFTYFIQKRIDKYQKRGFELSPYLHSVLQDYEPNPDIDTILLNREIYKNSWTHLIRDEKGTIGIKMLKICFNNYFQINDFEGYTQFNYDGYKLIHEYMKIQPSKEIISMNHFIFNKYFYTPFKDKCFESYLFWKHESEKDFPFDYPFLYSKMILINYQNGDLSPYFKSYVPIPIEEILEKYSLEKVHFVDYMIYVNYQK